MKLLCAKYGNKIIILLKYCNHCGVKNMINILEPVINLNTIFTGKAKTRTNSIVKELSL